MSDALANLLAVLDAEQALYERLCDVLRAERGALAALDVAALEALVREKEQISDEGRLLEESRAVVTQALAAQLGLADARPKLSRLCEALGDASPRLLAARQRLGALLALARELLEANHAVSASELANVQASLRALGAAPAGYGRSAPPTNSSGRLVRQAV
jgi:hypothetical protein